MNPGLHLIELRVSSIMQVISLKAATTWRRAVPALCLFFLATILTGCPRRDSGGDSAARVNGKKILRSEVDKYYKNQTAGTPEQPQGEQATSLRLSILKELVDNEIMMQRAEKLGLLATDEEVDTKINELKAPYTQEEFDRRLKEKNLTLDDLKRDMRRNLTVDKVLNKEIKSKITISDSDISNYYNQHKAEFNLIEPQYHVAQIVVTSQPGQVRNLKNDKAQSEAQARTKIQQILNRVESGEDFATVAMNYSEDPNTAENGGDMGFMPESALRQTDPGTRDAIAKLRAGQVSNVIPVPMGPGSRSIWGFRVIKLFSKEPAGQRDLNDPRVQQNIREQLLQRREQLLKSAYYEVVRNQAKVENYLAEEVLKNSGAK
jgi:peptidyl-prolyl cis-trans isomerase SurA